VAAMVVEGLPTIRDKLDRTDEFGDDAKAESLSEARMFWAVAAALLHVISLLAT
jgi:hypothetical protein